jgi:hypothetical protein
VDLEKRIAVLEQKLKETKDKAAKKAAAEKAREQSLAKANQQKMYLLAGEFLLDGATEPGVLVNAKNQRLDDWLKSPKDRKLFGLPEQACA